MSNIVEALKALGKKITGTNIRGDTIADSISDISNKYTGGGSGGSDIPVLEFEQTGNFDEMGYFTAVCNTENVDWIAVKNRIDAGKPVDAYFASTLVKDRGHSGAECDVFRLALANTYGPGAGSPSIEFVFIGRTYGIYISVNCNTAEVYGYKGNLY